ncbi:MAG: hypothetical protein QOK15_1507 [Nocardioidaceae bacterium]|nr:hypothetical protein [Nocardioidaceae bacterium]
MACRRPRHRRRPCRLGRGAHVRRGRHGRRAVRRRAAGGRLVPAGRDPPVRIGLPRDVEQHRTGPAHHPRGRAARLGLPVLTGPGPARQGGRRADRRDARLSLEPASERHGGRPHRRRQHVPDPGAADGRGAAGPAGGVRAALQRAVAALPQPEEPARHLGGGGRRPRLLREDALPLLERRPLRDGLRHPPRRRPGLGGPLPARPRRPPHPQDAHRRRLRSREQGRLEGRLQADRRLHIRQLTSYDGYCTVERGDVWIAKRVVG